MSIKRCQFACSSRFIGRGFCFDCTALWSLKKVAKRNGLVLPPIFLGSPLICKGYGSTRKEAPLLFLFSSSLGGRCGNVVGLEPLYVRDPLKKAEPF